MCAGCAQLKKENASLKKEPAEREALHTRFTKEILTGFHNICRGAMPDPEKKKERGAKQGQQDSVERG